MKVESWKINDKRWLNKDERRKMNNEKRKMKDDRWLTRKYKSWNI